MDREYMEDIDTMTEESENEGLNPDYDRVSGSGEMPSLEEFFGANYASDGIGASSDPFGNVIGDPVFAEGGIGSSEYGDAYGPYGMDDEQNDKTDTEDDEEQKDVKLAFKSLMDGSLLNSKFSKYVMFFGVCVLLAVIHIQIRIYTEGLIQREKNLRVDVLSCRSRSIDFAAQLMDISKVTEVAKLVEKRKLNIRKSAFPPMQFVMDKFERVDSIVDDRPVYEQDRSYNDDFNIYSR